MSDQEVPRWILWWMGSGLAAAMLLVVGAMAWATWKHPVPGLIGLGVGVAFCGPIVVYAMRGRRE